MVGKAGTGDQYGICCSHEGLEQEAREGAVRSRLLLLGMLVVIIVPVVAQSSSWFSVSWLLEVRKARCQVRSVCGYSVNKFTHNIGVGV